MILNIQSYLAQFLIYPFLVIFMLYIIGRPKFLVKKLNTVWSTTVYQNYKLGLVLILLFSLGVGSNLYSRYEKINELAVASASFDISDAKFDHAKKFIFLCERGVYLYFMFLLFSLLFLKFEDVYSKKFALEYELELAQKEVKEASPEPAGDASKTSQ